MDSQELSSLVKHFKHKIGHLSDFSLTTLFSGTPGVLDWSHGVPIPSPSKGFAEASVQRVEAQPTAHPTHLKG